MFEMIFSPNDSSSTNKSRLEKFMCVAEGKLDEYLARRYNAWIIEV